MKRTYLTILPLLLLASSTLLEAKKNKKRGKGRWKNRNNQNVAQAMPEQQNLESAPFPEIPEIVSVDSVDSVDSKVSNPSSSRIPFSDALSEKAPILTNMVDKFFDNLATLDAETQISVKEHLLTVLKTPSNPVHETFLKCGKKSETKNAKLANKFYNKKLRNLENSLNLKNSESEKTEIMRKWFKTRLSNCAYRINQEDLVTFSLELFKAAFSDNPIMDTPIGSDFIRKLREDIENGLQLSEMKQNATLSLQNSKDQLNADINNLIEILIEMLYENNENYDLNLDLDTELAKLKAMKANFQNKFQQDWETSLREETINNIKSYLQVVFDFNVKNSIPYENRFQDQEIVIPDQVKSMHNGPKRCKNRK